MFSIGIFFVETEIAIADPLRAFFVVQSWALRGLCYIFVALLLFIDNDAVIAKQPKLLIYINFSSLTLVAFGVLYWLMVGLRVIENSLMLSLYWCFVLSQGVFCLKPVRDNKMAKYIQLLSQAEVSSVCHPFIHSVLIFPSVCALSSQIQNTLQSIVEESVEQGAEYELWLMTTTYCVFMQQKQQQHTTNHLWSVYFPLFIGSFQE